jgi:hypothetical protein
MPPHFHLQLHTTKRCELNKMSRCEGKLDTNPSTPSNATMPCWRSWTWVAVMLATALWNRISGRRRCAKENWIVHLNENYLHKNMETVHPEHKATVTVSLGWWSIQSCTKNEWMEEFKAPRYTRSTRMEKEMIYIPTLAAVVTGMFPATWWKPHKVRSDINWFCRKPLIPSKQWDTCGMGVKLKHRQYTINSQIKLRGGWYPEPDPTSSTCAP